MQALGSLGSVPQPESSKSPPQPKGHHVSAHARTHPLCPEPDRKQSASWQAPELPGES